MDLVTFTEEILNGNHHFCTVFPSVSVKSVSAKWLYGHFILYNTRHLDGNFKKSTSQAFLIWFFSQLELEETSKIIKL